MDCMAKIVNLPKIFDITYDEACRRLKEPRRMWKRYIIGNLLFMWNICKE